MNIDLSTDGILRLLKWILPAVFVLVFIIGFLFWESDVDIIEKYVEKGYISSDIETQHFFEEFIHEELTGTEIPKLTFGKTVEPNTVSIYVITKDPKQYFRMLPMNAGYDSGRDAIFIEHSLVQLVMSDSTCKSCRELLSFIILHELGHRLFHRNANQKFDFISTSESNYIFSFIPRLFDSDFTEHLRTEKVRDEESKADEYAVDTYFRLKGEKGNISTIPFSDLPVEGLFSRLTQFGPYSPLSDVLTHPSILSRIERIYLKLSAQSKLDKKTQDFFFKEYQKWMFFHFTLQNSLFSVLVLPVGEIPVSSNEINGKIRIISSSGKLFEIDLIALVPKEYKPFQILHKEPLDTGIKLPFSPSPNDRLFSYRKSLFFLKKADNKLFRLTTTEWSEVNLKLQV